MTGTTPKTQQSLVRTMTVAVAVALVCSTAVTTAVQYLRPVQLAYSDLTRTAAIVNAAYGQQDDDSQVIEQFLALRRFHIDPQSGTVTEATTNALDAHLVPVFVATSTAEPAFVFPVTAKGMWSDIECYITLDSTLNTIVRLTIYEHAETPGIGDRIEDRRWLQSFAGKMIYNNEERARLHVGADTTLPEQHQVDAITGATISSAAIGAALRNTFGASGFNSIRRYLQEWLEALPPEDEQ